jgi:hypothetical protein
VDESRDFTLNTAISRICSCDLPENVDDETIAGTRPMGTSVKTTHRSIGNPATIVGMSRRAMSPERRRGEEESGGGNTPRRLGWHF